MIKLNKIAKCILNIKYFKFYLIGVSPLFEFEELLKKIKDLNTLIDIGSNKGQFILIIKKFFPKVKVYSFEPLKKEIDFQKRFLKKENINFFNIGLGNKKQKLKINVLKRRDSSSFLNPINNINTNYKKSYTEIIKLDRLDNVLKKRIKKPSLIKLDVQGFEMKTLIGCEKLIKKINYIIIEVSYIKTYHKQTMANDIIKYLNRRGFSEIYKSNKTKINGRIYQEDILFENNRKL